MIKSSAFLRNFKAIELIEKGKVLKGWYHKRILSFSFKKTYEKVPCIIFKENNKMVLYYKYRKNNKIVGANRIYLTLGKFYSLREDKRITCLEEIKLPFNFIKNHKQSPAETIKKVWKIAWEK